MVAELISKCGGTCWNAIGTRIATSADSSPGEITIQSPVANSSDNPFSQKLCSTQRRKKAVTADAPSACETLLRLRVSNCREGTPRVRRPLLAAGPLSATPQET